MKATFYRAFNGAFAKIGRTAPETIVAELVKKKCLPLLLYAVDACPVTKSTVNELQFALTSTLMKVFCTRLKDVADYCGAIFGIRSISEIAQDRVRNFTAKISSELDCVTYYMSTFHDDS